MNSGRRVRENGSLGTDHGTAGPVFLAGPQVNAGISGHAPSLTDLDGGDLKMQFDFRQDLRDTAGRLARHRFRRCAGVATSNSCRSSTDRPGLRVHRYSNPTSMSLSRLQWIGSRIRGLDGIRRMGTPPVGERRCDNIHHRPKGRWAPGRAWQLFPGLWRVPPPCPSSAGRLRARSSGT